MPIQTKHAEAPFPWHGQGALPREMHTECVPAADVDKKRKENPAIATSVARLFRDFTAATSDTLQASSNTEQKKPTTTETISPLLQEQALKCQALGCISFRIPPAGSTAGKILRHSLSELESLFHAKSPLLFKIGWTHDPLWRWANPIYGYGHDSTGWSEMIILYVSKEPYGPAMLEACLIEKFQSNLLAFHVAS